MKHFHTANIYIYTNTVLIITESHKKKALVKKIRQGQIKKKLLKKEAKGVSNTMLESNECRIKQ